MQSKEFGYIYVRDNELCRLKDIYKLGITSSVRNRNDTYLTYEHTPGIFLHVFEIPWDQMIWMDKVLKEHLAPFHNYVRGGGTEYYDRCAIDHIAPCLHKHGLSYRLLSRMEIDNMARLDYGNKQVVPIPLNPEQESLDLKPEPLDLDTTPPLSLVPHPHQQSILDIIDTFYQSHAIGKLVWACGLGKALLGILIAKKLKCRTVLIGVPSNQLQKQIAREICRIFPDPGNLLFVGGDGNTGQTIEDILSFLGAAAQSAAPKFVVSTYHSCGLLADSDAVFDLKIGDEAHHLVGMQTFKGFRLFHKIAARKSLFMTATSKTIHEANPYLKELYSMDDEQVFGKTIDTKTVHWAIENRKITDYHVLVLKNTEDVVDAFISGLRLHVDNKELFISCFMCLKSFEQYRNLTHVLLYTNTTEDAELAESYLEAIVDRSLVSIPKEAIYNRALHSRNCSASDLDSEVKAFEKAKYGIISCVYIFGEGFDLPKLNGVCIAGNMRSETRIVQYLLRPNRLEAGNPQKIAYVIIPYLDMDTDWDTNNRSFEKVRNIIAQLRNVDESIEQKMIVSLAKRRETRERTEEEEEEEYDCDYYGTLEESPLELDKIKIRLRYSKALGTRCTEAQEEFNYVRSLNIGLGILSRREYVRLRSRHAHFIENPEEHFKARGVWTNWYDFMGVDTTRFLPTKKEWQTFCQSKKITTFDGYMQACALYDVLPKEPADFYRDFTNIIRELEFGVYRRR